MGLVLGLEGQTGSGREEEGWEGPSRRRRHRHRRHLYSRLQRAYENATAGRSCSIVDLVRFFASRLLAPKKKARRREEPEQGISSLSLSLSLHFASSTRSCAEQGRSSLRAPD